MRWRLLALVATFVLAGCRVDTTVTVTARNDGTGTIRIEAIADAELIRRAPAVLDDLRLDDARRVGWRATGPTRNDDGSATVLLEKGFTTPEDATVALSEISGPRGPLNGITLRQRRTFGEVTTTLTGTAGISDLNTFTDDALLQAMRGLAPLAGRSTSLADEFSLTIEGDFPSDDNTRHRAEVPVAGTIRLDWTSVDVDTGALRARTAARLLTGLTAVGMLVSVVLAVRMLVTRRSRV